MVINNKNLIENYVKKSKESIHSKNIPRYAQVLITKPLHFVSERKNQLIIHAQNNLNKVTNSNLALGIGGNTIIIFCILFVASLLLFLLADESRLPNINKRTTKTRPKQEEDKEIINLPPISVISSQLGSKNVMLIIAMILLTNIIGTSYTSYVLNTKMPVRIQDAIVEYHKVSDKRPIEFERFSQDCKSQLINLIDIDGDFVTLSTDQVISGQKKFIKGVESEYFAATDMSIY
tara:strand:- start:667 stop:1368 length:702 start_codon:yes stop_codon:yes gene_type:complete